jgi:hypothetical protein
VNTPRGEIRVYRVRHIVLATVLLALVVSVGASARAARAQSSATYVEDFTDDANPAIGGFAGAVFVHTPGRLNGFAFWADLPGLAFPSPPHALMLFVDPAACHLITFPSVGTVTRAAVRAK